MTQTKVCYGIDDTRIDLCDSSSPPTAASISSSGGSSSTTTSSSYVSHPDIDKIYEDMIHLATLGSTLPSSQCQRASSPPSTHRRASPVSPPVRPPPPPRVHRRRSIDGCGDFKMRMIPARNNEDNGDSNGDCPWKHRIDEILNRDLPEPTTAAAAASRPPRRPRRRSMELPSFPAACRPLEAATTASSSPSQELPKRPKFIVPRIVDDNPAAMGFSSSSSVASSLSSPSAKWSRADKEEKSNDNEAWRQRRLSMEGRLSAIKAAMLEEKETMPRARQATRVVTKPALTRSYETKNHHCGSSSPGSVVSSSSEASCMTEPASPPAATKNQTRPHLPKCKAMRRHSTSDCVIGTDLPGLPLDNDRNKPKGDDAQNTKNSNTGVDYSKWDAALERYRKEQQQRQQEADTMPRTHTLLPPSPPPPRRQQRRCSTGGDVNDFYLLKNAKGYYKRDDGSKSTMSTKMSESTKISRSSETSSPSALKTKNDYYIRTKSRNSTLDDSVSSLEASMRSRSFTSSRIEDFVVGVGGEGGCASLGSLQNSTRRFQEDKVSNDWGTGSPTGVAGFVDEDVESNTEARALKNEAKGARTLRRRESCSSSGSSGIPRVPYPSTSKKMDEIKSRAPGMPLTSNARAECLAEGILSFQRRASCGSSRSIGGIRVPPLSTTKTMEKPKRSAPSMPLTNDRIDHDERVKMGPESSGAERYQRANAEGQQRRMPRRARRSSDCGITHGRPNFVKRGSDGSNKINGDNWKSVYDNLVGANGSDAAPRTDPRKGGGRHDHLDVGDYVDSDHRRGTGSHSQMKRMLQDHREFLADVQGRHNAGGAVRAAHSAAKTKEARKDHHSTMGNIADAARGDEYVSMLKKVWYQPMRRRGSMSSEAKMVLRNGE